MVFICNLIYDGNTFASARIFHCSFHFKVYKPYRSLAKPFRGNTMFLNSKSIYKKLYLALITGAAIMAPIAGAQAQLSPSAQNSALGTAGAGRVDERLQQKEITPPVSPSVEVKDIILQDVPENADQLCFQLDELQIEGVTAYDQRAMRPVYADKLGKSICLSELYAIATRLTNKYRNEGYILTQVYVPPQTIEGGTAQLRVLEGYLDSVSVEAGQGVKESELDLIRQYAAGIPTDGALNARELERYLLLINDLPGLTARSVLGAVEGKTGAASLRIIVERDSFDGLLAIDNHGSRYLGPVQGTAAGSVNSIFGMNERITAQVVLAPDPGAGYELSYFYLGYEQPINRYGTKLILNASHTSTEPGFDLAQFDVHGKSQYMAAQIMHPFVRSREQNLYVYGKFDWRDVSSKNILEAKREDRIRAVRVGGTYEFLDTWWKVGVNSINVELSQGLNIFGSSVENDVNLTRTQGDPQFSKMTAELQRLQSLTGGLNVLLKARGQWADAALLSSEEFGVGGMDIGRAYDSSEIIGDSGISGKIELQWNTPYQVDLFESYQLFSFFDAGRIWNDDATSSSTKTDTVTSAGFGIRADFTADIAAGFTVAVPLNRDVQTQRDDDPRVYFSLSKTF